MEPTVASASDAGLPAAAPQARVQRPGPIFLMDLGCVQPFYCAYLCRALLDAGADVTLASIRYHLEPNFFATRGLRNDPGLLDFVGRLRIQDARRRRPLKALEYGLNLAAWCVRFCVFRPAVVHVQQLALADAGLALDGWAIAWFKRLGAKIVHTVHNLTPHDRLPGRSAERRRREFAKLYRSADALICHGEEAKRALVDEFGIAPARVFVIPHGLIFNEAAATGGTALEERRQWSLPEADCVFLAQGFIKPYKGLDLLLDAWAAARRQGLSRATLVIAGAGDDDVTAALRQQAKRLGLGESVRLLFRYFSGEEVNSLYRAADVAVYPYREITSSGAVMTGVGHGKAIIASDLPLFRDLLPGAALFAALGDTDALAAILLRLARSPVERKRLQEAAATLASQTVSWRDVALATLGVYANISYGEPLRNQQAHDRDSRA